MAAVNLVVIVESFVNVVTHKNGGLKDFHLPSIVAVGAALGEFYSFLSGPSLLKLIRLGVKFILFLYCYSLRGKSSQVHVLWEDHRNDLWLNGFGESSDQLVKLAYLYFSLRYSYVNGWQ